MYNKNLVIDMYKLLNMRFKSIIKNMDDTSTVEFEAKGTLRESDGKVEYYLDRGNDHYALILDDEKLTVRQNKSTLHFKMHQRVHNQYSTAYGTLMIESYLEKMIPSNNGLKIIYELYDGEIRLARVYIQLIII